MNAEACTPLRLCFPRGRQTSAGVLQGSLTRALDLPAHSVERVVFHYLCFSDRESLTYQPTATTSPSEPSENTEQLGFFEQQIW
jgi:hypothetical protein